MIKLSVIVPVYKTPRQLLVRMFDSVCRLPMDTEIVCVFDSPGDICVDVLSEFASRDSRVKVLLNEKNIGETASRNRALDYISGRYFTCVDADDVIEPQPYIEAIALMEQYDLDACAVGMDGDGKTLLPEYDGEYSFERDDVLRQAEMSSCGIVYRTEVIRNNPKLRYPEGLPNNGDYVFATRFWWTTDKIAAIKKVGYHIVGHPDSSTRIAYTARRFLSSASAARMVMEVLDGRKLSARLVDFYARRLLLAQLWGAKELPALIREVPHNEYLADVRYAANVAIDVFATKLNPFVAMSLRCIAKDPEWLLAHHRLFNIVLRSGCLKSDMMSQLKKFVMNRVTGKCFVKVKV